MATKKNIEYGVFIAPVGLGEGVLAPKAYFAQLETAYPQSEGWLVVDRSVTAQTDARYLMVYHLEKVNG